jgi:hypothetical protein
MEEASVPFTPNPPKTPRKPKSTKQIPLADKDHLREKGTHIFD